MYLGDKVKDVIAGFEGVVVSYTKYLHNSDTVGVRSQELKDGMPQDLVWFDTPQCEVIQEKAVPCLLPLPECNITLGDLVQDTITGYKGVVIGITHWINGCVRIGIQSKDRDKDNSPAQQEWPPAGQIEVIKKVKEEKAPVRTGGPMSPPKQQANPKF